jgi:hypothetical protein
VSLSPSVLFCAGACASGDFPSWGGAIRIPLEIAVRGTAGLVLGAATVTALDLSERGAGCRDFRCRAELRR